MKEVVSNPTNEDLSIDNVINSIYEAEEAKGASDPESSTDAVSEQLEAQEAQESEQVAESQESTSEDTEFSIPNNVPKELQEAIESLSDLNVKKASLDIFKKMQGSFTKKNQEFSEQKKFADSIEEAFKTTGIEVVGDARKQLITNYLSFDKLIQQNPKEAVKRLMGYTKLSPQDFIEQASPTDDSDSEFYTETERKLFNTVETLNKKLAALEQQSKASVDQQRVQSVQEFKEAKDEQGNLLHPHFDIVKSEMMDLADSFPNMTISQLYAKAVRLNDDVYKQTLEAEKAKLLKEQEDKRKAEIEKAKKLNRQSYGVKPQNTTTSDMDAIFEKLAINAGF